MYVLFRRSRPSCRLGPAFAFPGVSVTSSCLSPYFVVAKWDPPSEQDKLTIVTRQLVCFLVHARGTHAAVNFDINYS